MKTIASLCAEEHVEGLFYAALAADNVGVRRTALIAGIGQVKLERSE
jgi:hypothetical protein